MFFTLLDEVANLDLAQVVELLPASFLYADALCKMDSLVKLREPSSPLPLGCCFHVFDQVLNIFHHIEFLTDGQRRGSPDLRGGLVSKEVITCTLFANLFLLD